MKADKELEDFIAQHVKSLLLWELLVFLSNNPGITDNAEGIASRLGRRAEDLRPPLTHLHAKQILKQWGDAKDPVYAYQPSPKQARAIEKFMQFNNSKQGKLIIWSQLLKHGMR
ncbi:MAG: hypothetical protein AB1439_08960 [candidate division FCPU426 bacterium]